MRSWNSLRNWLAVVITGCALVADVAGCGGDDTGLPPGDDGGGDVTTGDGMSSGDADAAAATPDADAAAKRDGDAMATGDVEAGATGDADATVTSDADAGAMGDADATTMGMGDADAAAATGDADAAATTPDADAAAATPDADAAATPDADAAPAMDADAAEATAPVCTAGSACTESTTQAKEVCTGDAGACVACTDQTDDPACQGAYGAGFICAGGACVPGNCHNSKNAAGGCTTTMAGQICGVSQANTCGDCTTDAQCQNDPYYATAFSAAGSVCNTTTHRCVTAVCAMANQSCGTAPNTNGNGADECCGASPTCVPGECCADPQCGGGMACVNHTCTACAAAAGNHYYVDPSGGSDNAHTGAQACAFKTITKALQFIGTANPGTQVLVLNSGPVNAGETFPIIVPTNVTIMTASGQTGPAVIAPPANKIAFTLDAPLSGLSNLTIDGAANNASGGIAIYGGSALTTTVVQSVTVTGTVGPGVVVSTLNGQTTAGMATIGPGVLVTKSGTTLNPEPGILVMSGNVIITGSAAAGAGHTSISNNTQHGISVSGTGFVTITGNSTAATAVGQAYVDANNNVVAGLFVAQTPALVTALQTNVVTGLEVTGTSAGNGLRITAGSYIKLRNSFVLGNSQSGVIIPTGTAGNTSLANIDLGTALSPGRNTLQGPLSNLTNPVAGVCLAIGKAGETLNAAGDIFGVNKDCVLNVGAHLTSGGCQNGVDIGGIGGVGNANTATVTTCTLQ